MPRIDFYILKDRLGEAPQAFACRLAEKAYRQGHRLYIHFDGEDQLRHFDELLWTFRQGSFVPHARQDDDDEAPVRLGCGDVPPEGDVLLNLSRQAPGFYGRFQRVLEVVGADEGQVADGRARFRYYRQQGETPVIHNQGSA